MRIDLGVGGIAAGVSGLGAMAGGFRSIARAQERVSATAPKFVSPVERQIKRAVDYAAGLREVAAAQREVGAAQKTIDFKQALPALRFTAPSDELAERAGKFSTALGEIAKNYREVGEAQKSLTFGGMQALSRPRLTEVADKRVKTREPGLAEKAPGLRFIKGPEQRRAEIAAQREQLVGVDDSAQRGRIGKDLDRADFLAQRSITLHQRRMQNPEESLNRPGLLELFGDLNKLFKDMASGNVGAVVKDFALGIRMIPEKPGGLNISQKLSRAIGTSAPAVGAFNPDARGVFQAADLAAGHAGMAGQIGKVGGVAESAGALGGIGEVAGSVMSGLSGIAAAAGPVGIEFLIIAGVVTVAMVAVKLLSEGIKAAVADLAAFRDAMQQSGGTSGDISRLTALGIPPDQIAGMASAFREKTAAGGDVMGQIGRARLGLGPVAPGPFGPANEAQDLVKAIEGLRKIADPNERLKVARMTGTTGLLGVAASSNSVFAESKRDAAVTAGIRGDKRAGQDAADLQANGQRLFGNLGALVTAVFKPFIAPLSQFVGMLANVAREGARYASLLGRIPTAFGRFGATVGRLAGSIFGIFDKFSGREGKTALLEKVVDGIASGIEWLASVLEKFADGLPGIIGGVAKSVKGVAGLLGDNPIAKGLSTAADQIVRDMDALTNDSATRDNTKAMQKLTGAVEHASGTFGGGARARGALGPSAVTGQMRTRAIEANAIALGYWTL